MMLPLVSQSVQPRAITISKAVAITASSLGASEVLSLDQKAGVHEVKQVGL
jgi:hypothetical protein